MKRPESFPASARTLTEDIFAGEFEEVYSKEEMDTYLRTLEPRATGPLSPEPSSFAPKVSPPQGAPAGENLELPRPSVLWFADRMEAKLRKNDHKGGWKASELSELLVLLEKEVAELGQAAFRLACLEITDSTIHGVIDEAVDVANFAMMIADNARTYKKALEVQVE